MTLKLPKNTHHILKKNHHSKPLTQTLLSALNHCIALTRDHNNTHIIQTQWDALYINKPAINETELNVRWRCDPNSCVYDCVLYCQTITKIIHIILQCVVLRWALKEYKLNKLLSANRSRKDAYYYFSFFKDYLPHQNVCDQIVHRLLQEENTQEILNTAQPFRHAHW